MSVTVMVNSKSSFINVLLSNVYKHIRMGYKSNMINHRITINFKKLKTEKYITKAEISYTGSLISLFKI